MQADSFDGPAPMPNDDGAANRQEIRTALIHHVAELEEQAVLALVQERLNKGDDARGAEGDRVLVLETEVDDAAPQILGPLVERLLDAGALDAYLTPVQMKKGRPGILVTVLAPPARRGEIEELLFRETTTLGVRRQEWDRTVLERETVTVETAYGPIRVKIGRRGGRCTTPGPSSKTASERRRRRRWR